MFNQVIATPFTIRHWLTTKLGYIPRTRFLIKKPSEYCSVHCTAHSDRSWMILSVTQSMMTKNSDKLAYSDFVYIIWLLIWEYMSTCVYTSWLLFSKCKVSQNRVKTESRCVYKSRPCEEIGAAPGTAPGTISQFLWGKRPFHTRKWKFHQLCFNSNICTNMINTN